MTTRFRPGNGWAGWKISPRSSRCGSVHEMTLQASFDRQQFDQSDVKKPINEVIFETQVWF